MAKSKIKISDRIIMVNEPMVLIPLEEYKELLFEAGYLETPELDKEISEARKRFKKGEVIDWETLKSEISKIQD